MRLEIGQKLDHRIKVTNHNKFILTGPASIERGYGIEVEGCKYDVVFNTNRTIKGIFTNDKRFSTVDNIKVGMSYNSIKSNLIDTMFVMQSGWARHFTSKSGWKIAFDYDHNFTDTSKVLFIFKNSR